MATKQLLRQLSFRSLKVPPMVGARRITVRYGESYACAGHTSAKSVALLCAPSLLSLNLASIVALPLPLRKFAKNYLPALLYASPSLDCTVEKYEKWDNSPAVVIAYADGTEKVFDTKALSADFSGRVDREVFRQITGLDIEFPKSDPAKGNGSHRPFILRKKERILGALGKPAAEGAHADSTETEPGANTAERPPAGAGKGKAKMGG
jgi:hypothetical protein